MQEQVADELGQEDTRVRDMARVGMALGRELRGHSFDSTEAVQESTGRSAGDVPETPFSQFFENSPSTRSLNKHFRDFSINNSLSSLPSVEHGLAIDPHDEKPFHRDLSFQLSSPSLSETNLFAKDKSRRRTNHFLEALNRSSSNTMSDSSPRAGYGTNSPRAGLERTPIPKRSAFAFSDDSPVDDFPKKPETPWGKSAFRTNSTPKVNKANDTHEPSDLLDTPSSLKSAVRAANSFDREQPLGGSAVKDKFTSAKPVKPVTLDAPSIRLPNLTNLSSLISDSRDAATFPSPLRPSRRSASQLPTLEPINIANSDKDLFIALRETQQKVRFLEQERDSNRATIQKLELDLKQTRDAYVQMKEYAKELKKQISMQSPSKRTENDEEHQKRSSFDKMAYEVKVLKLENENKSLRSKLQAAELTNEDLRKSLNKKIDEHNLSLQRLGSALPELNSLHAEVERLRKELRHKELELQQQRRKEQVPVRLDAKVPADLPPIVEPVATSSTTQLHSSAADEMSKKIHLLGVQLHRERKWRKEMERKLKSSHRKTRSAATTNILDDGLLSDGDISSAGEVSEDASDDDLSIESDMDELPATRGKSSIPKRVEEEPEELDSYLDEDGFDWGQYAFAPRTRINNARSASVPIPTAQKGNLPRISNEVQRIINQMAAHEPSACTVCNRKNTANATFNALHTAATEDDDDNVAQRRVHMHTDGASQETIRPSQKPKVALHSVAQQLKDEMMHLKLRYQKLVDAYNALPLGFQKRRRVALKGKMCRLLEALEAKADQIYALHDVDVAQL
ncbi:spindle pole body protein Ppc89 [Schizosaccharomyces japonicus yFS275]|uniref:Spindle pole body protein Ppc89 n=1 Tax=Schizosaccharomyces japonicus (strain yFS275 / FY16936) TaxID=402676 RepID=B6K172_SCHJY|nr:spindle pole body protein Ppc89 [Schizosaccharomyces japonicus yFS275]EEB07693.1 spindle pole body protein Ppc89 [Schizosaccharomyces japonicus yFS275]